MIDWQLARFGIYKITNELYVGQYPKSDSFSKLREIGIKNILNVSGGYYDEPGFKVYNIPIMDLTEMPIKTVDEIINVIQQCVINCDKLYVHCIAGQNRSPGSVFIGLISIGYSEKDAVKLIEDNTLDSVAKHGKIITDNVMRHIRDVYAV